MTNLPLSSRIVAIKKRIDQACKRSNRNTASVTLLAVSKTKPLVDMEEAYHASQRHFGENYAQEAVDKRLQWSLPDTQWHFIGPVQSNKTRLLAENYDWVHTLDRFKIATRLSEQRPDNLPALNVLIQVNISDDPAKSGLLPENVEAFAKQVSTLKNLCFKGLMTITASDLSEENLKKQFQQLKLLQETLIKKYPSCQEVSMGMSRDFELAITCGATIVRIGSDIFGSRS